MTPEYTQSDILKELGLDQMPEARMRGVEQPAPSSKSMMTFKMALSIVDPIESASFMRYVPDWVEIDQSLDAGAYSPDYSRAMSLFTDIDILTIPEKVRKSLGLSSVNEASNHYIMLANDLARHLVELGAVATSPVLIFRTSGGMGHRPLLGGLFKLRYEIADGQTRYDVGSNLGLLTEKRTPELHVDEA